MRRARGACEQLEDTAMTGVELDELDGWTCSVARPWGERSGASEDGGLGWNAIMT